MQLPDAHVTVASGEEYVSDGPADAAGGGGTRYFVFTARERGDTTIVLFNCFQQSCTSEQNRADDDDPLSPDPKPSYVTDWDELPQWQQKTDADIFERIERKSKMQEGAVWPVIEAIRRYMDR